MNNLISVSAVAVLSMACASDYEIKGREVNVDPGQVTDCPFTPVPGTKISVYDCNPVFENDDEELGGDVGSVGFYATEIMGHPFYQMWYTTNAGGYGDFTMNYAVSPDGTNWDTHPENPLFESYPGAWDQDSVAGQVVVWDPKESQYVMSYQGFNLNNQSDPADDIWGLGIATSPDGKVWDKHPNNPVIDFNSSQYSLTESESFDILFGGTTDKIKPCWPLTITVTERGAFRGYLAASKWQDIYNDPLGGAGKCEVYRMDGFDAGSWVIDQSSPVLAASNDYDAQGVTSASVVRYGDLSYMFYIGFEAWEEAGVGGLVYAVRTTLNLATSTDDGVTWQKDPNNPIPINLTSPGQVSSIGAQVIGTRIHLWVGDGYDGSSAVGYFYYEPDIEPHEETETTEE